MIINILHMLQEQGDLLTSGKPLQPVILLIAISVRVAYTSKMQPQCKPGIQLVLEKDSYKKSNRFPPVQKWNQAIF